MLAIEPEFGILEAGGEEMITTEPKKEEISLEFKLPTTDRNQTITASSGTKERSTEDIAGDYDFTKIGESLGDEIASIQREQDNRLQAEAQRRLRETVTTFILEVGFTCVIFIALAAAVGLIGIHISLKLAAAAFIIAAIGIPLGFVYNIEVMNPIRIALSSFISIPLLRWFVGIRHWPKVFLVAIISRVITITLIWGIYAAIAVV